MALLTKAVFRINAVFTKCLKICFIEVENNHKMYMREQKTSK